MTTPGLSLPAKIKHIDAYAGDDLIIEIDCTDVNQLPLNFSSYTGWKAETRVSPKSDRFFSFVVDTSNLAIGKIELSLTDDQTQQMAGYDKWGWDLECIDSQGKKITLFKGTFSFDSDWTR